MTEDEKIKAIQHHLARKHRIWPVDRHWIQAEFLLYMYEMRPAGTSKRPPWQHGRHKTRGGRDQDRWRNVYPRVKRSREALAAVKNACEMMLGWASMEEYCQANGLKFRRLSPIDFCDTSGAWPVARVTVDGVDECGVAVQMAEELQCDCEPFSGALTLTLSNNPDCDFVKGGE